MLSQNLDTNQLDLDHNLQYKQFAHLHNHIILCGLHNLGYRILEQMLEAKISVIVIDDSPDPRFARLAYRQNVPVLAEDSRLSDNLELAGIERAQAVIAVHDSDLYNLETVLAANEVARGVRTVASFYNREIGQQLLRTIPNARALDLTELAAPVFVNAAFPSDVLHRFSIQGQEFIVVDATPEKQGQLSQVYPNAVTLLLRSPSQSESIEQQSQLDKYKKAKTKTRKLKNIVCPPADAEIEEGDHIDLIGRPEELKTLDGVDIKQLVAPSIKEQAKNRRTHKRNRLAVLRDLSGYILQDLERPFRITLIALLVIIIVSTLFFTLTHRDAQGHQDLSLLDALYFTITIITTIGFGDISLTNQDWWVVIFGILLELIGASSLAVLYAFLTNFIVSRRIEQSLGIQRATDMENHTIVTSLGNLGFGYRVVEGLIAAKESVIVVESEEQNRFVPLARTDGATVIFGDSRLAETLKRVNVAKARCIVIASNDDMTNLETALAARSVNPTIRVVLRLFDRNLADKIERTFGIENASSTSAVSAPSFVAAALDYEVVTSFYIRRQVFIVVRIVVNEGSQLVGKQSNWLYKHSGVRVLAHIAAPLKIKSELEGEFAVRELDPTFYPSERVLFKADDSIIFVGTYDRVLLVHQLNLP